jgi:acetyl esterase/lipase
MNIRLDRRQVLQLSAATATLAMSPQLSAADAKTKVSTYTYKRVGDLEIKLDVHRADDDVTRPVIVWIHGGALINGNRVGVSGRVKKMMLDAGYALVSIDYRLAPETQLPGIIEDIEDAFKWIRKEGPKRFNVDTRRIAVAGGSAGGCLTLVTGYRVKPRPTVLVSFWGYGDLVGDWYSKPSPHPRHNQVKITENEARDQVDGPPISDSRERDGNGGLFYNFCRQRGIWPKEVSGWDPLTEPEKFYPYMSVKNVTAEYTPTMLIHGTNDTDVPYEQSTMMAEQFEKHKVPHELVTIRGGEHGLGGGDPKLIDAAYESAFEFIQKHMKD